MKSYVTKKEKPLYLRNTRTFPLCATVKTIISQWVFVRKAQMEGSANGTRKQTTA